MTRFGSWQNDLRRSEIKIFLGGHVHVPHPPSARTSCALCDQSRAHWNPLFEILDPPADSWYWAEFEFIGGHSSLNADGIFPETSTKGVEIQKRHSKLTFIG